MEGAKHLDRQQWIKERRLWNEVQMDIIYAREYDEKWGSYINPSHRQMIGHFLDLCPPGGQILDAACGTGKNWPILLERGFTIQGSDQSAGMLRQTQAKFPGIAIEHIGLQELAFVDAFDGVMCLDAMENVFPEGWPLVLSNLARAAHAHSPLYFTVEFLSSEEEVQIAYEAGKRLGLPLIYGEYAHHGGYHYYPTNEQVLAWIAGAGLTLLERSEGDEYWHYLVRT